MDLSRRCSNETEVGPNEQDRPTSTRCPIRPRKRNPWQKVIDLLAMAKEISVQFSVQKSVTSRSKPRFIPILASKVQR